MCIHQLIARQAATTPGAVALAAGDDILSYFELNQRANQLAHTLQALGVGPDTLVALCLERSPELVIALLGILKAGGAYVPLDPSYPPERLSYMAQDAQASVLITRQDLRPRFHQQDMRIICLDGETETLARQSTANPMAQATPDHLAYVIYTSGSTGQPKGVQITHRSLLNLISWHQCAFAVTAADRATQIASPAFDAGGWELWPYLACGACVLFPGEETRVSPALLRDWLIEQEITITFLPTPLAERMLTLDWPRMLPLRFLLTGADTLHHYPSPNLPFTLINNYGPTEATVVATSGRVPPLTDAQDLPTLGWPIAHTQIFLLDEQLQEAPAGQPGELYIGGAGLARGYHNRPELTAERFITSPFDPSARLYKTGDLARRLPDGQIAFLGRVDHQIKLRGYRIEPDEIVTVLNQHPAVLASLVLAREDPSCEKRLVAYVALAPEAEVTAPALREHLAASLPDYMLPAIFVGLSALPIMPSGKIDRAALPAPGSANTLRESAIAHPTTPTEARLVEIVAPLLGLKQLGVDDNFFMLGGHSLLGTQIIMRVSQAFGVNLTLLTLFEAPTIRQLSAEIEQLVLARLETLSEEEIQQLLAEQLEERIPAHLEG
ncbi:MAG TPA: amino acid adenylation domain-containing protein [Ktedonobacterales bacterium]|nr:amino acid adenylation domain-containing protein [Ktedonobacterales bacterium]